MCKTIGSFTAPITKVSWQPSQQGNLHLRTIYAEERYSKIHERIENCIGNWEPILFRERKAHSRIESTLLRTWIWHYLAIVKIRSNSQKYDPGLGICDLRLVAAGKEGFQARFGQQVPKVILTIVALLVWELLGNAIWQAI